MSLKVYLSGEIHTDWREQIIAGAAGLDVTFSSPVTDHAASDDCGVAILGAETDKYWHDHKGAMVNAIRTRKGIQDADINIFKNLIHAPTISQRPLISPLSFNAFMYYNFYLEQTFLEGEELIHEIRVEPIFKEEALFSGTLYIKSESYEPEGYELAVNKGAMSYFK